MRKLRIGKFYIHESLTDNFKTIPRLLNYLKFIPFRVEYMYAQQRFLYVGISVKFDLICEPEATPTYTFEIEDGKFNIIREN